MKKIKTSQITPQEFDLIQKTILENDIKKILEVGVSYGGTTNKILKLLNQSQELISVDISKKNEIGCLIDSNNNFKNFKLLTGGTIVDFSDKIGENIDLVILDTSHVLPGEILDFLMVYPKLNTNSFVIIHDVSLFLKNRNEKNSIASILLSSVLPGRKTYNLVDDPENEFSNLVVIKLEEIFNFFEIFNLLLIPWDNFKSVINIDNILKYFKKHYSNDIYEYFKKIYKSQINLRVKNVITSQLDFIE